MSDFYECSVCGNKIHRSRVPNSVTGDVMCCGKRMLAPGDTFVAILTLVCIGLTAAGTAYLTLRADWSFWGALGVSFAGSLASLFVLGPVILNIMDRLERRKK